jgi:hypothetical protein
MDRFEKHVDNLSHKQKKTQLQQKKEKSWQKNDDKTIFKYKNI